MTLKPVDNYSLADHVTIAIRESILNGTFPPGAKLTEPTLARELETSRGPVREALRNLEEEGLVKSQAHRSVRVVEVSREEVEEVLVPIRVTIEQFAFRRLADSLEEEDGAELQRLLDAMQADAGQGRSESVGELDLAFHSYVVNRAAQEQGARIWQSLQPRMRAHFRRELTEQNLLDVVHEHQLLFDALLSGDQELLMTRVAEHITTYPSANRRQVALGGSEAAGGGDPHGSAG